jgi:CRP-like cAMP-binding protein
MKEQARDLDAAAAISRIASLAPISAAGINAVALSALSKRTIDARRELFAEGVLIGEPLLILSGWACRTRVLHDGRRQVLGFLFPGDFLGNCRHKKPVALSSVTTLTDVMVCPPPSDPQLVAETGLAEAYAISAALEEHYLLRQIVLLGRMSALERIADWALEIRERLESAGLAEGNLFRLPVTQEVIADALGLTPVHVNRTLKAMRREGLLESHGGTLTLLDVNRLVALVNFRPARVCVENV